MPHRPTVIERAYELAAQGEHAKVSDLKMALRKEGYDDVRSQLEGPAIMRALRARLERARLERGLACPGAQTRFSRPEGEL